MRIELVTPHTRSLIYRACKKPGDHWNGKRKGVKIAIRLTTQPTLEGDA